ncbi:MAG: hypothetical protein ACUVX8_13425 [Candidatus Zipacnadales bacterium]
MSKLRPLYVIIPGIVLIIGAICVFAFVLLPPVNEQIKTVTEERDKEKGVAETRPQVEARLEEAERKLDEQTAKLTTYMRTRSIPISTYQPVEAMIKFWYELQEDLAPALEEYIESSGCRIISGAALPAPTMAPPTLGPSNFIRIPQSGALNFTVRGTMEEIRKLYTSLNKFERVATIEPLDLTPVGSGEELDANVNIVVYILAEGPEGGGGAAPGAAPGAGPTMGPSMGPGMGPSAAAPSMGPGAGGGPAGGPPAGGAEETGGGKGAEDMHMGEV